MSVEIFPMDCPNCGRRTVSGLIYECQFCSGIFCREGGSNPNSEGCALQANAICPHCKRYGGYGDNCFDLLAVRRKHGFAPASSQSGKMAPPSVKPKSNPLVSIVRFLLRAVRK